MHTGAIGKRVPEITEMAAWTFKEVPDLTGFRVLVAGFSPPPQTRSLSLYISRSHACSLSLFEQVKSKQRTEG